MNKITEFKLGEKVIVTGDNMSDSQVGKSGIISEIDLIYEYPYRVDTINGSKYWSTVKKIDVSKLVQKCINTETRKCMPIFSGVISYFPDALLEVSKVSKAGNDQHSPGEPLHWDRSKSTDELDALTRHLVDHAKGNEFDYDGIRHMAKVCWRSLAYLQKELEHAQIQKK